MKDSPTEMMFSMDLEGAIAGPGVPKTARTAVYKCPEDGRPDNLKYPTVVETPDGARQVLRPVLSGGNVSYQDFTDSLNALMAFESNDSADDVPSKYDLIAWEERGRRAWMAEWHALHGIKGATQAAAQGAP